MSQLEMVLNLVPEEKLDELIDGLTSETRQALANGMGAEHTREIAQVVWHLLEEE